ncbi:glycoside hydrolase family 36 N-terminal domain-containing protein [Streptomyces brasiliscabiei]|uniref:glycoside hydrolase family 36 N-terminal domain-containing protein n=1 Tax=Streptomyces brasiliscabiei TaxID=2736302 RepID=UPI001F1EFBE3|nr:glycoside hydrolase family 36 N-terminal domain-containing protein [Streptomyces brasiliscabiei]
MPQHDSHQWVDSFPWSLAYRWGHSALTADFDLSGDAPGLLRVRRPDEPEPGPEEGATGTGTALPLVRLTLLGDGTEAGGRLRYRAHHSTYGGTAPGIASDCAAGPDWHRLTFELHDPTTGLTAFAEYASPDGVPVLRSRVRLRHDGTGTLTVGAVASLLLGGLPSSDELLVLHAHNDRLGESRWHTEPLRNSVPGTGHVAARRAGRGGLRTDGPLATGALRHRRDGRAWLWRIESAAGWAWEAGESAGRTYLALGGPTHDEHRWCQVLAPGAEFTTEWAVLALGTRFDDALSALAACRRALRDPRDRADALTGEPVTD